MYSKSHLNGKQQAIALYASGQVHEARDACLALYRDGKADAEVLCLLGVISGALNCFADAERYSRLAVDQCPDYVDAHYNLGQALRQLGHWGAAGTELQAALDLRQDDPDILFSLGSLQEVSGDYSAAIASFAAAQQARPGWQRAIAGIAGVLEKQGDAEGAYRLIRPLLREQLPDGTVAVVYGRLALRGIIGGNATGVLERVLSEGNCDAEDLVQLHFALGALYDMGGDYSLAFPHYHAGNELKKPDYDPDSYSQATDRVISRFNPAALAKMPRASFCSELPVFVVGMMRSGTSLVEQILSSHPDVYGAGELGCLEDAVNVLNADTAFPAGLTRTVLDREALHYLGRIESMAPGARRIIDKMPRNYFHLGYVQLMLPGARVIHCTRDPLDTCLSSYFQNFTRMHPATFDLEWLGRFYNDYRRLMRYWLENLDVPVLEVNYEQLLAQPDVSIRRMVEFCDLAWDDRCLRHQDNSRLVKTASYNQANKQIYANSLQRWRNYVEFIGPLVGALGRFGDTADTGTYV